MKEVWYRAFADYTPTNYGGGTDEFGYDKYEDRKRLSEAWRGCMSAYNKWSQFGIDIYEIANWLQETYNL